MRHRSDKLHLPLPSFSETSFSDKVINRGFLNSMNFLLPSLSASIVASFTPGPNNGLLMRSAMALGFRKTIMHILGVVIGFNVLFLSVRLGLYQLITYRPTSAVVIKTIGTIYFTYLAYKIIRSSLLPINSHDNSTTVKPFSFWQAFFFQWVNIKGWFFCISVIATIPIDISIYQNIAVQVMILTTTASSAITWALLGMFISKLFSSPIYLKMISIIFALMLLYAGISPWT